MGYFVTLRGQKVVVSGRARKRGFVCSMSAPFPSAVNIFVLFTYKRLN